jgi:hypothetical protein
MDLEFPSGYALPRVAMEVQMNLVPEPEGRHRVAKNLLAHAKVAQGPDCHVAADSRKAIEVEDSHGIFLSES